MKPSVIAIFITLSVTNFAFAEKGMVLTCKNKPVSSSTSKSKPASCKLENSTTAEKNQDDLKAVADACNENVTGLTDDFVRSFKKVFPGYFGTVNPDSVKETIKQYKLSLEMYKANIEKYQKTISEFELEETQEKRNNFAEKKKQYEEKHKSLTDQISKTKDGKQQDKLYAELAQLAQDQNKLFWEFGYLNLTKEQLENSLKEFEKYIKNVETTIAKYEADLETVTKQTQEGESEKLSKDRKNVAEAIRVTVLGIKSRDRFVDCGLTDVELFAISHYTGNTYRAINSALRTEDPVETQKYQFFIDALNSGLSKLGAFKKTVRRGTTIDANSLKEYCTGCIVKMKAFTSTSRTSGFPGAQRFVIQSKTGAYIDPISSAMGEEEVLFKPGAKFKVLKIKGDLYTLKEVD